MLSPKEAILVPVGDISAIARGIREIRMFPDQARARADRAWARVENDLSIERWVELYASVYRDCLLQ
jgi:glycosyltransferase involved in cell wall biosynthesis